MRRVWIAYVLPVALLPAISLHGQRPSRESTTVMQSASGSISGDVYLVMQSGDIKKGAGRTVYLVRDTPALSTRLAQVCSQHDQRYNLLKANYDKAVQAVMDYLASNRDTAFSDPEYDRLQIVADSAFEVIMADFVLAVGAVRAALAQFTIDSARTGLAARYEFRGVVPGKYRLFAETEIGTNDYQWWASISVRSGQATRKHLDHSVVADGSLYCNIRNIR